MAAGNPTSRQTLSSTSTTSAPWKLNRGSIAGEKRENVSIAEFTRAIRLSETATETVVAVRSRVVI